MARRIPSHLINQKHDFEGFILGKYNNEYGSLGIQNSTYGYNEGGGTISVVKVEAVVSGHYRNPRELILDKVPGVSFVYSIHEPDSLRKHISQTTQRDNHWMSSLIDKELKLREEIEENDDILLVDTIDVYQNIPQKLLIFHQWALESINFKYLLKTDDDCYLDLEKILDILEKYRDKKKIWWGRFRHNWAVDLYGKWAEHSYRSTIYPTFACGSGNILSKDLVQWTVSNIYDLYLFQGEDVSLGIWLAAVNPHIIDDPLWQCESECISGMYSLPDLNAQHLRYYWNNKLQCSDPCGCD